MIETCPTILEEDLSDKEINRHEKFIKSITPFTKHDYRLLTLYKGHKELIRVLHIDCDQAFWVTPRHFYYYLQKNTFFCSRCTASNGEKAVHKALEVLKVPFDYETTWDGLVYKYKLRFDFTVFTDESKNNVKCHIEYDGLQHDKPVSYFGGEKQFNESKKKDILKDNYCLENDHPLIRIKYSYPLLKIESLLSEILFEEIPIGITIISSEDFSFSK